MNGPELSDGGMGNTSIRRKGGSLECWDQASGCYVPYVPNGHEAASPPAASNQQYAPAPVDAGNRYTGQAAYPEAPDALDQYAPEVAPAYTSSYAPKDIQAPRVQGRAAADYSAPAPASGSVPFRQQGGVRHSGRRAGGCDSRQASSQTAIARLLLSEDKIHHSRVHNKGVSGTAWTPEEGFRFKYEFELDLSVSQTLRADRSSTTVGFSAAEIRNLALQELVNKNIHLDPTVTDTEAGEGIHNALVFNVRLVSVSNTLNAPVSITLPQHQGMNVMHHNRSARPVFYVANAASHTTVVNHQKDLSHELHSPVMNMLCQYAGDTDMPDAYRVHNKTNRYDVKYDSLLWAMAGADPKYHDEWRANIARKNKDQVYVQRIAKSDVSRWIAMSLTYVYQKIRMRPLFPRHTTRGRSVGDPLPDDECFQVRFQPLPDDSGRDVASQNTTGIVSAHFKVFCCIPVKVSRSTWQGMYMQTVKKGGAGFIDRAAPAHVFLEEGSGPDFFSTWEDASKNAIPEVAMYGDFSTSGKFPKASA